MTKATINFVKGMLNALIDALRFFLGAFARDLRNNARIAGNALKYDYSVLLANFGWELERRSLPKKKYAVNVIGGLLVGIDGEKLLKEAIEQKNHERYLKNMMKARKAAEDYARHMKHNKMAELKGMDDVPSQRVLGRKQYAFR